MASSPRLFQYKMGRKKDKPRDRSYLEVRFQNLNNKKKLCPFAFQVVFFVFLFDCLISTCFLEKIPWVPETLLARFPVSVKYL